MPSTSIDLSHFARRPVSRELLLAQACAIGDRLSATALWDGERADWIGLTQLFERTWQIISASLDLQSGLPALVELTEGQVQIAFVCGLLYVRMAKQLDCPVELLAAPVLHGSRYQNRPLYFSDVIVHKDSS